MTRGSDGSKINVITTRTSYLWLFLIYVLFAQLFYRTVYYDLWNTDS